MAQILRPYQVTADAKLRANYMAGVKSQVLVVPCGGGKTTIAAHIIHGIRRKGSRALFLAHRKELIGQCSKRLYEHDIPHGIIQSGNYQQANKESVQVASIQTLINRLFPKDPECGKWVPESDLLIIDEGHRSKSKTYLKTIEYYVGRGSLVLLLTATPARTDGSGLGDIAQAMVEVVTIKDLISQGYLSDFTMYEGKITADTSKVHIVAGEFNQTEIGKVMDDPDLIADVYESWAAHAQDKQTIIFAQNRSHGHKITTDFEDHGVNVAYVDDKTPGPQRDRITRDYAQKRIQVLVNLSIYGEGFDVPSTGCVVLAMATASLIRYLQFIGRGMRPEPGKRLIINDHGRNWRRHGLPDQDREWSLQGRKKGEKPDIVASTTCPVCRAIVRATTRVCPECGFVFIHVAGGSGDVETAAGVMVEVSRDVPPPPTKKQLAAMQLEEERTYLREVYDAQTRNNYRFRYALVKWKDRFKDRYNNGKGRYPGKKHGVHVNHHFNPDTGYHNVISWTYNGVTVLPIKEEEWSLALEDKTRGFSTTTGLPPLDGGPDDI